MALWRRGRRLFTVAAVLMLLSMIGHTLGQFAPPSPGEAAVIDVMRGFRLDFGLGLRPTFFDVFRTLAFVMSVTFAGLAVLNLIIAADAEVSPRLLRRVTWVNLLWVSGFLIVAAFYQVVPPLVSGIPIDGLLVASLLVNRPVANAKGAA